MTRNTKKEYIQRIKVDLLVLIFLPIIAAILTLTMRINLLESTLLYFGLPCLYLSWRNKDIILRSLIFAGSFTVISILTDYFAERDQSWTSTSNYSFRFVRLVPIEALVWVFLFTYLIVAFYQFYFDPKPGKILGKRMPYLYLSVAAVLTWLFVTTKVDISSFVINYYYIKFGLIVILLPLLLFSLKFPRYIRIFLVTAPYFFVLSLVNVLVSLQKGHWHYIGHHFIGWVQLGSYRFPMEELLFWMILYSSFVIAQFEYLNNDSLSKKVINTKLN